jgi:hypothetical protein
VHQSESAGELLAITVAARRRNWIALVLYILAIPGAYPRPAISLVLILGVAVLYGRPEAFDCLPQ